MKIKKISSLPEEVIALFGEYAQKTYEKIKPFERFFYSRVKRMWLLSIDDKPVCVIGIIQGTLIGTGIEIFFFLCTEIEKHLRKLILFLRRAFYLSIKLFHVITVSIDDSYKVGARFVNFFGFRPTLSSSDFQDVSYTHYELRQSWLR